MTISGKYFLSLLLLAVCEAGLTDQPYLAGAAEHPEALVVYVQATDVHFIKRGPSDQVTYHVRTKFPAAGVIDWISQRLREAGWRPLSNDSLDPSSSSSQMRSWHERLAGLNEPDICLRQWIGDWKDSSGNIVRYAFRYKEQCASKASTDLEVFAGYYSEAVVRQLDTAFEQFQKTLKAK
jgi:hypothetical protein